MCYASVLLATSSFIHFLFRKYFFLTFSHFLCSTFKFHFPCNVLILRYSAATLRASGDFVITELALQFCKFLFTCLKTRLDVLGSQKLCLLFLFSHAFPASGL